MSPSSPVEFARRLPWSLRGDSREGGVAEVRREIGPAPPKKRGRGRGQEEEEAEEEQEEEEEEGR